MSKRAEKVYRVGGSYPFIVPADPQHPIRVIFSVHMSEDACATWLNWLLNSKQRNSKIKAAVYRDQGPTEEMAMLETMQPLTTALFRRGLREDLPELFVFSYTPESDEWTTVEGVCWGVISRRHFDIMLTAIADARPEARAKLREAAATTTLPILKTFVEQEHLKIVPLESVALAPRQKTQEPTGEKEDRIPEDSGELPMVRAKRLGVSLKRLERLDSIEEDVGSLTQAEIAEKQLLSEQTIQKDIALMKAYRDDFPLTCRVYGEV